MKKKKTIIFDFDDTLFDTKNFKKDIFRIMIKNKVDKKSIASSYKDTLKKRNYTFKRHLKELSHLPKTENKKIIENLNVLLKKNYILPKVQNMLQKAYREHKIILLSKGERNFQMGKIKKSGIKKYFGRNIYIVENKKEDLLKTIKLKEPVYFINDKKDENEIIKKIFPKFKYFLVSKENPVSKIIKEI